MMCEPAGGVHHVYTVLPVLPVLPVLIIGKDLHDLQDLHDLHDLLLSRLNSFSPSLRPFPAEKKLIKILPNLNLESQIKENPTCDL
jgi:hypothetical protein